MSPTPAVAVRELTKSFGATQAVRSVTFDIPAGEFVGLVGPNGAGKTTMLSMITGLLRPDRGGAAINGHDVWTDPVAAKRMIGILPEGLRMFERLSGTELLAYTGGLRGMDRDLVAQRSEDLLAVLGLTAAGDTLVADYSTGMRKKIGLAAALLHNPSVLFLDEPFEGVDPVSAEVVKSVLRRFASSGSTVIFSSHVLELVERLCTWVAIMAEGRIIDAGPLEVVRHDRSLHDRFLEVVGGGPSREDTLAWLGTSG